MFSTLGVNYIAKQYPAMSVFDGIEMMIRIKLH